jgi:hypothetical protein
MDYNDTQRGLADAPYLFNVTVLDISEAAVGATRKRIGERKQKPELMPGFVAADVTKYIPEVPGKVHFWHDR